MNYIDLFALLIIFLGILVGYNQGFLKSVFNVANIILSLLIGLAFYGMVSKDIIENEQIIPTVIHFSEASEMLGGIENESISVYEKSYSELEILIENSDLPYPIGRLVLKNIENQAFAKDGIETLGDYLGLTIGSMTVNYVSFTIVFLISFSVLMILISLADYVFEFPILHSMDSVAGAIGGFLQGLLFLNMIFLIVPLVLAFLPCDELMHFVDGSSISRFYYEHNILIKIIKGII